MAVTIFEKITREIYKKVQKKMKIETDPIFDGRPRKVFNWIGFTGIPSLLIIASIITLFWIYYRIYGIIGFEKTVISLLLLILLSLRAMKK